MCRETGQHIRTLPALLLQKNLQERLEASSTSMSTMQVYGWWVQIGMRPVHWSLSSLQSGHHFLRGPPCHGMAHGEGLRCPHVHKLWDILDFNSFSGWWPPLISGTYIASLAVALTWSKPEKIQNPMWGQTGCHFCQDLVVKAATHLVNHPKRVWKPSGSVAKLFRSGGSYVLGHKLSCFTS